MKLNGTSSHINSKVLNIIKTKVEFICAVVTNHSMWSMSNVIDSKAKLGLVKLCHVLDFCEIWKKWFQNCLWVLKHWLYK